MKIAIACIVKNEFDYILEWIAYHRKIVGITDFIIADNVSTDGTTQLLEALDLANIINRVHFPRVEADKGIQVSAYNHILEKYGDKYDYIAFIDADEFIVNNSSIPLNNLLKKNKPDALALNWRIFGSSSQYYQTNRLTLERFTLASRHDHKYNHHIKTILKPSCVNTMYVHHASLKKGGRYSNANFEGVSFIQDLKDFLPSDNNAITPFSSPILNDSLYIAHYVVKSKSEHMDKKAKRGSAAGSALRQKGIGYFKGHDLNQVECLDLYKHKKLVLEEKLEIEDVLVKRSYFYTNTRIHVDRFDTNLSGWLSLNKGDDYTLKILINDITEQELKLDVTRNDVCDAGLSNEPVCGFSINIKPYDKNKLKIWFKGTNIILWDGFRGY